ncbi:MAG: helix-turn-helix transcriptional regulator [Lutisporaceae bacterium]|jgi:AraC family transcriptional regulator
MSLDLTGAIPFKNNDSSKSTIENYYLDNVAVVVTDKTTNIAHGTHCHDSYEFIMAYADIPSALLDNKIHHRSTNSLFAINPMQEHGMAEDQDGFPLCGIHVSKSFMQNVSVNMFNSPDIIFSNDSFNINHDLSMLIRLFLEELKYKQLGHDFIIEHLSLLIAGKLTSHIDNNLRSKPQNTLKYKKENIKKVIDYMNENYYSNISCDEMSELIQTNKFIFIRSFKAETGRTPYEYLLNLKIEKAKKMLKSNEYTVTEISMMCGFSSHSHFTSTFKKKVGISPTEYKINS